MAILLLVSDVFERDEVQFENDLVGVYEDDQTFSEETIAQFNFLQVNGAKSIVKLAINAIKPIIAIAYEYEDREYTYSFTEYLGETVGSITVWQPVDGPGNKWYLLVNDFKFSINVGNLTPEEKQLLATYDITNPAVQAFIKKIAKDLSYDSANNIEVTDLRNTQPG